jgi:hypothetical protein
MASTGDTYQRAMRMLDLAVQRRLPECDVCGEPFAVMGGPHESEEDGLLCDRCRDA